MASFYDVFSRCFEFFSRRRIILYGVIVAVMAASILILRTIKLSEDIKPMLPEGESEAAVDFRFLQQTPFLQKVVINLRGDARTDTKTLIDTADAVAGALRRPYYSRVITGPDMPAPDEFFPWLLAVTPSLITAGDMERIKGLLTPEAVDAKLRNVRTMLGSGEGMVLKPLLREDPLQFYLIILEKLRYVSMFKGMVLRENHFISADGKNVLLLAETPVKFTDAIGSKDLVAYTRHTLTTRTPQGITPSFLSGHAYTTANAEAIKEDLYIILTCASIAILVLLLLFMQNWRALFVFLVPTSVVCIATAGILCVYDTISAVTIAFGSVLMGIADDYPIFTYFSLRNLGDYGGRDVARISRPVLFSGLTTMATFSALFFSELPGQRQIALFSIIGITASLIFSLVILPHFIKGLPPAREASTVPVAAKGRTYRTLIISGWLVLLALCLWQGGRLKFNGDMRAINLVPKELSSTEEEFKNTWGDFRGMAMVFTEGGNLESALEKNDRLFTYLKGRVPGDEFMSLAPLLPSAVTQAENRQRWKNQWSERSRSEIRSLVEKEGEREGFTPHAFEPFFDRLSAEPAAVTMEGLKEAGFSDALDSMVVREGTFSRVLSFVPDTPEVGSLFKKKTDTPFVARFVSNRKFNDTISAAMVRNFVRYIVAASLVILVALIVLFRDWRKVLYAGVPVLTGTVFMFGAMGWKGIEFNLFNIIATILVIGLSVDLGIFMVSRSSEGNNRNTNMAVLLGGMTSLIGMGALALARHPALYSIGISVLLGMVGAIPSALFVIPAFQGSRTQAR